VGDKDSEFATVKAKEAEGEKGEKESEKALANSVGGIVKLSGSGPSSSSGKKKGSKATPAPSAVASRASSVATDLYPLTNPSGQGEKPLGNGGVIKLPASIMVSSSGKNLSKVVAPPSNTASRASSVATDSMPISNPQAHATKAPTKMRMILAPESDGDVDVDMAGPDS
jgi:hypothetical protein